MAAATPGLFIASAFGQRGRRRRRLRARLWKDVFGGGNAQDNGAREDPEQDLEQDDAGVWIAADRGALRDLGCFADAWVRIGGAAAHAGGAGLVHRGKLKYRHAGNVDDEAVLLLAPQLWANLGFPLGAEACEDVEEVEVEPSGAPEAAAVAIIAAIPTPLLPQPLAPPALGEAPAPPEDLPSDGLELFFSVERILAPGDVFAVRLSATEETAGPPQLRYFVVVRLETASGDDAVVARVLHRDVTTVSATAPHHAFLPRAMVFRQAQLQVMRGDAWAAPRDWIPRDAVALTLRDALARHFMTLTLHRVPGDSSGIVALHATPRPSPTCPAWAAEAGNSPSRGEPQDAVADDHAPREKGPASAALRRCALLIQGPTPTEVQAAVSAVAADFGLTVLERSWADLGLADGGSYGFGSSGGRARERLARVFAEARSVAPTVLHLSGMDPPPSSGGASAPGGGSEGDAAAAAALAAAMAEDAAAGLGAGAGLVAVVGSVGDAEAVGVGLRRLFTTEATMGPIAAPEALAFLRHHVPCVGDEPWLEETAQAAAGSTLGGLAAAVQRTLAGPPSGKPPADLAAAMAGIIRPSDPETASGSTVTSDPTVEPERVAQELCSRLRAELRSRRGGGQSQKRLPQIPQVRWEDVGGSGLAVVRRELSDAIELPLRHPEAFSHCLRKGLLLYGPPGTGKTLIAKCVATEIGASFLSVKGPELLDMYVGESEKNVRRTFQTAKDNAPCVLFFDELDSLAPARGRGSDGGGVLDRVVSQLLTELDGVGEELVFVLGATNRPDLIDPSLLRAGRFDRYVYLGVDSSEAARLSVLGAQLRKCRVAPGTNLEDVVRRVPDTFTNADLSGVVMLAQQKSLMRKIRELEDDADVYGREPGASPEEGLSDEQLRPEISQADLEAAVSETVPSVSRAELHHYEELRKEYANSGSEDMEGGVWSGQH